MVAESIACGNRSCIYPTYCEPYPGLAQEYQNSCSGQARIDLVRPDYPLADIPRKVDEEAVALFEKLLGLDATKYCTGVDSARQIYLGYSSGGFSAPSISDLGKIVKGALYGIPYYNPLFGCQLQLACSELLNDMEKMPKAAGTALELFGADGYRGFIAPMLREVAEGKGKIDGKMLPPARSRNLKPVILALNDSVFRGLMDEKDSRAKLVRNISQEIIDSHPLQPTTATS
ncbi:MAG: hypothetical protein JW727_05725 [Candidatus Aenigmarchaeota archaeon]|nr:hypothetical protein [Candidatus Aenigmarchaeota archaeon]